MNQKLSPSTILLLSLRPVLSDLHHGNNNLLILFLICSTLYAWLNAFLIDRCSSLEQHKSPGRPPKLTPSQKQRLRQKQPQRLA